MTQSLSTTKIFFVRGALALIFLLSASAALAAGPVEKENGEKPRVIVLGFDGLDAGLAARFIDEGRLPRLKELSEKGAFNPLLTTNPAQSPVAWGSIVTGLNPGKTNIGGFIMRKCDPMVMPVIATVEDKYKGETHTRSFSDYSVLNGENKWYVMAGGGLVVLIFVFFIFRIILSAFGRIGGGVKNLISFVLGCAVAAITFYFFASYLEGIPEEVPFPYNLQQGESFWNVLSENDIRCTGLYVPGAYPCLCLEKSKILGGLGVPDVSGSTGTWYIYTDDDWVIQDQSTRTGGRIIRLDEKGGLIQGPLFGPKNFVKEYSFDKQIRALRDREAADKTGPATTERRDKEREYRIWKKNPRKRKSIVEFTLDPDRSAGSAVATVAGQKQTLTLKKWSDWFRVDFEMSAFVKVPALVRMRLIRCDEEQIRLFVPPIDISPKETPPYLRISSPEDFAGQLCDEVGLYETVGWSCITHGLKDEEITEEVFLEDIEYTMTLREKLLDSQLDAGDFDTLMAVFYSPDRLQHMIYRLFDDAHPTHDAERAAETVRFFGEDVALADVIPEIYEQVDRIVGKVLDRIESGDLGDDVTLLIVSDHGFAPFYYGVNLNNFLVEKGYMKLARNGGPITIDEVQDFSDTDFFALVDWERTKAYSLGLGKVFINLEGREPDGIVSASDYDAVRDAIVRDLEDYVDPRDGQKVVRKAFKRDEVFSGSYWKEGDAEFCFNRTNRETRKIDGFADIFLGFKRGYRVSWQTTMGGLEEQTIVQNEMRWSGDHVSVMPDDVMGVFFSNRRVDDRDRKISVVDLVPTIYRLYGIAIPDEIDGSPLELTAP